MPELPEVETTRQGLLPHMMGKKITRVVVRDARLRWPVPTEFAASLTGLTVTAITRRGKYLLWECRDGKTSAGGFVLSHLGMSGTLRVMLAAEAVKKHDHVDVDLESGATIRFNDPRRFGFNQTFTVNSIGISVEIKLFPIQDGRQIIFRR